MVYGGHGSQIDYLSLMHNSLFVDDYFPGFSVWLLPSPYCAVRTLAYSFPPFQPQSQSVIGKRMYRPVGSPSVFPRIARLRLSMESS